jgi:hypothetical protein
MPALTKKKKRKTPRDKPFTGLTDRYGQVNLQLGAENPSAIEMHRLLKKPSRKRPSKSGSMATEWDKRKAKQKGTIWDDSVWGHSKAENKAKRK